MIQGKFIIVGIDCWCTASRTRALCFWFWHDLELGTSLWRQKQKHSARYSATATARKDTCKRNDVFLLINKEDIARFAFPLGSRSVASRFHCCSPICQLVKCRRDKRTGQQADWCSRSKGCSGATGALSNYKKAHKPYFPHVTSS